MLIRLVYLSMVRVFGRLVLLSRATPPRTRRSSYCVMRSRCCAGRSRARVSADKAGLAAAFRDRMAPRSYLVLWHGSFREDPARRRYRWLGR